MIYPDKTFTDNPFVDNLIYYAKLMALNSVVKDEDEALEYETPDSLEAGDVYISCIEQTSVYELFKSIPVEILEKYIARYSNLDLYVDDPHTLVTHLNSMGVWKRTDVIGKISKLARIVYIDHYDIMMYYIEKMGPTWAIDNRDLYDKCCNSTATYVDLFNALPEYTMRRIIKQYLNNYDNSNVDNITTSLEVFQAYIDTRTDINIDIELDNISKAMRNVFKSHYEMMIMRGYVSEDGKGEWYNYKNFTDVYDRCINGTSDYEDLYDLFPPSELRESLLLVFDENTVGTYNLTEGLDILKEYFNTYSPNPLAEIESLNKVMMKQYIANYNLWVNFDIYNKCKAGVLDYFDLVDYLPRETKKIVINSEIEETTNLDVYSKNKQMLNSYLNTLPNDEAKRIKEAINIDMREYYPKHHIETNNYYRYLIGLPPMEDGVAYEDTLIHSYDADSKEFKEFGNKFIRRIPKGIYPDIHWKQPLCEFDDYDIGILKEYGILDDYVAACGSTLNSTRYRYIRFLGDEKLDLYTCRRALNFQLIGVPTIDDTVAKNKFIDNFAVNRDFVIRTVYTDSHKFQSDYYNKFIIIFILINTIMDMLTGIPELIINRDVFDSRCIRYLFESFGIPYYSEIPVKYQRAMLKNLNILIKYKSSTRNMIDICNLFGFSDIRVFGYYLFKECNVDTHTGEYLFDEKSEISYDLNLLYVRDVNGPYVDYNGIHYNKLLDYRNYDEEEYLTEISYVDENGNTQTKKIINNSAKVYLKDKDYDDIFISLKESDYFTKIKANVDPATLKFIKVPIDDELTKYKNDTDYIINYDEIVYADEGDTWDGGLEHEVLRQDILDYEFNAVKSKYISIETVTEMTEMAFQVAYFYNMLFDNMYSEEALTVEIPYIKIGHKFRFMDIVCYLFALMYLYNGINDNIMYSPTQILYIKGYNFDNDINEVMKDPNAFTQPEDPMDRENIFDINERIEQDGYDYHEAFKYFNIRSFNLQADMDELDKWLKDTCQMTLDDFIVDDTLTTFDHIITLRQFFSLKNSYYQKSIFENNLLPLPYNQLIKYAFGFVLYQKELIYDIDGNRHEYVKEVNGDDVYFMEVINSVDDIIYIMDYNRYAAVNIYTNHAIYRKFSKTDTGYELADHQYYILEDNEYKRLFDKSIYIKNNVGDYVFSADAYYKQNENKEFEVITDEKFFTPDIYEPDKKVLHFGEYYVKINGVWVLDPDNCYVLVTKNGESQYVLLKDIDNYKNHIVAEEDCFVLHSDGHFIPLTETDYWRRTHSDDDLSTNDSDSDEFVYNEEDCYIIVDEETEYYDPTVSPRVYYKKLSDYYTETNWLIYRDTYYVKDPDGNFIKESDLLSPNNCYYKTEYGEYDLVVNALTQYINYKNPKDVRYDLVLQANNDFERYAYNDSKLTVMHNDELWYVKNSDSDFVTVLLRNAKYDETKNMIVVFNKAITKSNENELEGTNKYNPEVTDGIWDENDWIYTDPSYEDNSIGMNGENKWYYKKPGEEPEPDEDEKNKKVGSGFYMESSAYIGSVEIEKGNKYYMAFDIETNFTGRVQIYCTADSECVDTQCRVYDVTANEPQHVAQVFTANEISKPEIRFLIYDFDQFPIDIGDYISVSNIRFVKAHSDNFIAQDIPSYDKLQELYRTNEAIYKYLANLLATCTDLKTYKIYKKLYDSLMISKYNKEAFKLDDGTYAKTYTDFLQTRDAVLYERLTYFKSLDPDAMHKQVADNIVEVTYGIDDCIDTYSYGYLYSYFPAVSANYIQQYISKIINFFKSWKVHLLGINTVYRFNDPMENTIRVLEDQSYRIRKDVKANIFIYGDLKINPLDAVNVSGIPYTDLYDDLTLITNRYSDKVSIKDRLRMIVRTADSIKYVDDGGQLHLILHNERTKPIDNDGILIIKSETAGFSTVDTNKMLMTTDEDIHDAFENQKIGEINHTSIDIIEWEDYQDDE